MVRKIVESVPDEILQKDLEKYRQRAIELGAADARIITTDMVVIDEHVRAKCEVPRCDYYGTNVNCPPHAMDIDMVRKVVNNFTYAIFYCLQVSSEELCGTEWVKNDARISLKSCKIASKIESDAFYDGYHLAIGFSSGPCQSYLCSGKECIALIPGQACRYPLRARSAMEGVGMDAFTMAAKVGWDVYSIGDTAQPPEVPCGRKMGLVLIY